jgi:hypothetical protein
MKKYFLFILCGIWVSCQDVKYPERPENLIPEEEMIAILTEVYLINSARSFDNKTIIQSKVQLDTFLFKKFKIDSLQFALSNAYYTSNLNTYNRIFVAVEERLTALKTRVDSVHKIIGEREKRIQDSILQLKNDSSGIKKKGSIVQKPQLINSQQVQ